MEWRAHGDGCARFETGGRGARAALGPLQGSSLDLLLGLAYVDVVNHPHLHEEVAVVHVDDRRGLRLVREAIEDGRRVLGPLAELDHRLDELVARDERRRRVGLQVRLHEDHRVALARVVGLDDRLDSVLVEDARLVEGARPMGDDEREGCGRGRQTHQRARLHVDGDQPTGQVGREGERFQWDPQHRVERHGELGVGSLDPPRRRRESVVRDEAQVEDCDALELIDCICTGSMSTSRAVKRVRRGMADGEEGAEGAWRGGCGEGALRRT